MYKDCSLGLEGVLHPARQFLRSMLDALDLNRASQVGLSDNFAVIEAAASHKA